MDGICTWDGQLAVISTPTNWLSEPLETGHGCFAAFWGIWRHFGNTANQDAPSRLETLVSDRNDEVF